MLLDQPKDALDDVGAEAIGVRGMEPSSTNPARTRVPWPSRDALGKPREQRPGWPYGQQLAERRGPGPSSHGSGHPVRDLTVTLHCEASDGSDRSIAIVDRPRDA